MNLRVIAVLAVALLGALVLWARGCTHEEVEQVKASLQAMVTAVQTGDGDLLEAYIAADYSDRLGHDQAGAVRRVMSETEHYPAGAVIELDHLDVDIEEGGYARVRFVPRLEGEADEALKLRPHYDFERGQRLVLRLRKHGQRWLVVRADMGYSMSGAL